MHASKAFKSMLRSRQTVRGDSKPRTKIVTCANMNWWYPPCRTKHVLGWIQCFRMYFWAPVISGKKQELAGKKQELTGNRKHQSRKGKALGREKREAKKRTHQAGKGKAKGKGRKSAKQGRKNTIPLLGCWWSRNHAPRDTWLSVTMKDSRYLGYSRICPSTNWFGISIRIGLVPTWMCGSHGWDRCFLFNPYQSNYIYIYIYTFICTYFNKKEYSFNLTGGYKTLTNWEDTPPWLCFFPYMIWYMYRKEFLQEDIFLQETSAAWLVRVLLVFCWWYIWWSFNQISPFQCLQSFFYYR